MSAEPAPSLHVVPIRPVPDNSAVLAAFELTMRTRKLSEVTITHRLELVRRLAAALPCPLVEATPDGLARFQSRFSTLARASVDIYTRHIRAFYKWALAYGHVDVDPCGRLVAVQGRRGTPHPINHADLRTLLACARGGLRTAYILAAFAGLRCGEIARLRGEDLELDLAQPVALIHGKGDRDRVVPLLPPVVEELRRCGFPRRGHVVARDDGRPYTPDQLSTVSHRFMLSFGVRSTLHSLRHFFASEIARMTKDVLLVRDLLGHSSLQTTQIYMHSSIEGAQERLAEFSLSAADLVANQSGTVL